MSRFVLNDNGRRIASETLLAALAQALEAQGLPEAERPNLALWRDDPLLPLPLWRQITGNDRHSRQRSEIAAMEGEAGALKGSIRFSALGLYIEFRHETILDALHCPRLPDISVDFYGNALPVTECRPGPFQAPPASRQVFLLTSPLIDQEASQ